MPDTDRKQRRLRRNENIRKQNRHYDPASGERPKAGQVSAPPKPFMGQRGGEESEDTSATSGSSGTLGEKYKYLKRTRRQR